MTLIIDAGSVDAHATLGFESDDCGRDFRAVVDLGARVIEPPTKEDWASEPPTLKALFSLLPMHALGEFSLREKGKVFWLR
jgi:hypothetical protein